jgi:hypothetical protein
MATSIYRAIKSKTRAAFLRRPFPQTLDRHLARIARLCVLFEDLRIEVSGLVLPRAETDPGNDPANPFEEAGHSFRMIYFANVYHSEAL